MAPSYHSLENSNKSNNNNYPFMTCIVRVNPQSSWDRTVRRVLKKCHGVYNFRMDEAGLVEISGTVDPNLLLKMLGRAGRKAELHWFQFGECSSNLYAHYPNGRGRRYQYSGSISPWEQLQFSTSSGCKIIDELYGCNDSSNSNQYRLPYDYNRGRLNRSSYDDGRTCADYEIECCRVM